MTATRLHAWIYDYLARIFDAGLEDLPDPPAAALSPEPISSAIDALRTAIAQSPRASVLATHAHLFVVARGGIAAPPYASWYLDAALCGPACEWVRQAYATQGVECDPDAGEPPDYIGTELEFMYFLARHELAARSTGDDEALHAVLEGESEFVLRHLAAWLPDFIASVRAADPGPVYEAAVNLLDTLVRDDARRLSARDSKLIANGRRR